MIRTTATLVSTAAGAGLLMAPAPAGALELEREKSVRCSAGSFATLSLEKEFGRIDADFEIENTTAGRSWKVRMKHNGSTVLRTARMADYEGDLDLMQQVRDSAGKDRFVVRATGPNGEVCRVKLGI